MKRALQRTLIAACVLLLPACEPESERQPTAQAGIFADATIDESVAGKWARSCALCHAGGVGGAPRMGIASEWQPRIEQGEETLLTHTIEGFNNMPPLGYCMSCEREDFRALIRMMAGGGQ